MLYNKTRMTEKPKVFRSLDELGSGFSESIKQYPVKEVIVNDHGKPLGDINDIGHEDYELQNLTPEEKGRFEYYPTYGMEDVRKKQTKEYIPSEEYFNYRKEKEESAKLDIKRAAIKLFGGNNNGTIKGQQMPESSPKTNGKGKESARPSEGFDFKPFIDRNITYYRGRVAGNNLENQLDFRQRPFDFMRRAKWNAINKKKGEIASITGSKAVDVNRRSDLNKEIIELEKEIKILDEIISKKIPAPEDKYFDKDEIAFDKNIRPAIHKDSIVTIKNGNRSASYVIERIEKGVVHYSDLKRKGKGHTKLSELEKALRNPENKILNVVKNPDKKTKANKPEHKDTEKKSTKSAILPEKFVAIKKLEDDLGFVNAALLTRELKISKDEADELFREYENLNQKETVDSKEPATEEKVDESSNEKIKEIDRKLKEFIQKQSQLLKKREDLEVQIQKTKKELYLTAVPKGEGGQKFIGWEPSKFAKKIEDIKIRRGSKPEKNNGVFEMGYPAPIPKPEDTSRYIEYKPLEQKQDVNRIDDIPFEEIKNEDIKVNPVHVEGPVEEFKPVELVNVSEEKNSEMKEVESNPSSTTHYVKEYKEPKPEENLNEEELRREIQRFFDENFLNSKYKVRNVNLKFLDKDNSFDIRGKINHRNISIRLHGFSNKLGVVPTETKLKRFGIISSKKGETWEETKYIASQFIRGFQEYLESLYGQKIENINLVNRKIIIQFEGKK